MFKKKQAIITSQEIVISGEVEGWHGLRGIIMGLLSCTHIQWLVLRPRWVSCLVGWPGWACCLGYSCSQPGTWRGTELARWRATKQQMHWNISTKKVTVGSKKLD